MNGKRNKRDFKHYFFLGYIKNKSNIVCGEKFVDLYRLDVYKRQDVETIARKIVKVIDTVEPEEELVAKYEDRYQKFRKIYPTVKELF